MRVRDHITYDVPLKKKLRKYRIDIRLIQFRREMKITEEETSHQKVISQGVTISFGKISLFAFRIKSMNRDQNNFKFWDDEMGERIHKT